MVEARGTDPGIFPLLFALGEEWSSAMREVYRRGMVRAEPWFTVGLGGVRGELIARGWSQHEATSMLVAARRGRASSKLTHYRNMGLPENIRSAMIMHDHLFCGIDATAGS